MEDIERVVLVNRIPVTVPLPRRPIVRKRYDEGMGVGFRCVQPRGTVKKVDGGG